MLVSLFQCILCLQDTSGRKVNQHRLKCAQSNGVTKNGSAVTVAGGEQAETDQNNKVLAKINSLVECQSQLHTIVNRLQYFQFGTLVLVVFLGILLSYVIYLKRQEGFTGSCTSPHAP